MPSGRHWVGVLPLAAGVVGLLACVREFHVAGQGTLAPWSPARHLVRSGLYRFARNPMYVSVLAILLGWSSLFDGPAIRPYTVLVACAIHARILLIEEPWLERTFGREWHVYRAAVPRWLGLPACAVPACKG
jgi:protein-S-isoprenylcysteine O-methyltransferase Ste14